MRLFAIAAFTAMLWSSPAAAQFWGGTQMSVPPPASTPSFDRGIGKARHEIRDARRAGQLTREDAKALRREQRLIGALQRRYASDGMSDSERAEIATRLELLRNDTIARRSRSTR